MKSSSSQIEAFPISQADRLRARKQFNTFSVFNTFSFLLLSGNIITLYLLRLGARSTLIGVISSFAFISFFFMLVGRLLVPRFGVSRLFAYCWTVRYLAAVPLIFSPFFIQRGNLHVGFALVVIGALGFQVMRGVGLVSNSPILGDLSEGKDRGDYLSKLQIIAHTVSLITGLLMALLLGPGKVSLYRYSVLILIGILFGLLGCVFLFKLPKSLGGGFPKEEGVLSSIRNALADVSFVRFIRVFALVMIVAGMSRPFLVLFTADVYQISDGANMYLTVVGSLGALFMGMVAQLLLDRVGPKPMLIFFSFVFFLSLITLLIPFPFTDLRIYLYLGAVFFFFNFGTLGQENAFQTYFFGAIRPQDQMNLGILYYLIFGVGGTLGSALGGVALDWVHSFQMGDAATYRFFFAGAIFLSLLSLLWMARIAPIGSVGIRNALSIMFSARDLRAILLLNKLERTTTIEAERRVIQEIRGTPSMVSLEGLLQRVKSPSFVIRREALHALEVHEPDERVVEALLHELQTGEFTTAYRAARILGLYKIHRGIPLLRASLHSEDYFLSAESMVALARLGDVQSKPKIEAALKVVKNPFLIIYGTEALKIFQDRSALPILLDLLEKPDLSEGVRNHIILGVSGLYGMENWFYPLFTVFLEEPYKGLDLLTDLLRELPLEEPFRYKWNRIKEAYYGIPKHPVGFKPFAEELLKGMEIQPILNPMFWKGTLYQYPSVTFLIGAILVYHLNSRSQE